MPTSPLRDQYDDSLPVRIYYQDNGDQYAHPSVARQIRESLSRSRAAGLPFGFAWAVSMRHLMFDHERDDREAWQALLDDPSVISAFECAYHRRRHRGIDAVARLAAVLEAAEIENARRRHVEAARV